jgi:hypothetical protein
MTYKLTINGRFCCIEDKEFEFLTGANFLFGPNGSGKSSLLRAINWAWADMAIGDRGNLAPRPEGTYTLRLANGVFDITSGRTEREGLIFSGSYPNGELKGERKENYKKFLGWLDISGNEKETILERIQFDPASPSIFTFVPKRLLEEVTASLSPRTKVYQAKYKNLMIERDLIATELKQAKQRSQDLSGSEYTSTEQIEDEIKLEIAKINNRPEPFKLAYFERNLLDTQNELKAIETNYRNFVTITDKQCQELRSKLTNVEFDEEQVKKERDAIFAKIAMTFAELKRLNESLVNPKPCENCGVLLLEDDNKYIVANLESIKQTKEFIKAKHYLYDADNAKKDSLDKLLKLAEIKRQLVRLETNLSEKTTEYEKLVTERKTKIQSIQTTIKNCQDSKPFWDKISELQQRLAIIRDNNERVKKLEDQSEIIKEFEHKFICYDFHRTAGIRDLLYSHFTQQCSRFSSAVNEVLYACDLGKIEFVPESGKLDNSIEKIRLRHCHKGNWRPYDQCEDSLKKILDFAAWLANRNLNPKKVDCLKLMMVDDVGSIFDERLERFLSYLREQPVVLLFAWAFRDCEKYLKPVQTIILGE